eukprot:6790899-Karenia_brevis.AAC.1
MIRHLPSMPTRGYFQAKTPRRIQDSMGRWSQVWARKQGHLLQHDGRGHLRGFAKWLSKLHCSERRVNMRVMSGGN